MTIRAVIFDLDDTLVPEYAAWDIAFTEACACCGLDASVDVDALRRCVFKVVRELWHGTPVVEWARTLGFGGTSSLLSDYPGEGREFEFLRGWAPLYRITAWRAGLAEAGIRDAKLAHALSDAFRDNFAAGHKPYDDAVACIEEVRHLRLGVITNGPADLQRAKLRISGLEHYFPLFLISGEVGWGKPDARIFQLALDKLGVEANEAVMVGDNPVRDIGGAHAAGMHAVWLDRDGSAEVPSAPHQRIVSLCELSAVLKSL